MALPEDREPLIRYLTVQAKLDRELSQILRQAARDTERMILRQPGSVRSMQLQLVLQQIRRIQQELWVQGVGESVADALQGAEEAAERSARALDTYLTSIAGTKQSQALIASFESTVERGLVVDAGRIPPELSTRVYRNADIASGRIERIIRSALIRGLSAKELAKEVKAFIDPATRGGASYAAMRLGRSELNSAFHQQQIIQADRDWVKGVKWNLSRSHPKKDDCDTLASHNEGLGRGVWNKRNVPDKPHPQCLCFMTYEMVSPAEMLDLIAA